MFVSLIFITDARDCGGSPERLGIPQNKPSYYEPAQLHEIHGPGDVSRGSHDRLRVRPQPITRSTVAAGCSSGYQDVLVLVGVLELEVPRSHQYSFDGPHAVVVMELGGQLLGAEPVRHHDLHRQRFGVQEAVRIQRDLCYQRVVGHHHGHRSEQHLHRRNQRERWGHWPCWTGTHFMLH